MPPGIPATDQSMVLLGSMTSDETCAWKLSGTRTNARTTASAARRQDRHLTVLAVRTDVFSGKWVEKFGGRAAEVSDRDCVQAQSIERAQLSALRRSVRSRTGSCRHFNLILRGPLARLSNGPN